MLVSEGVSRIPPRSISDQGGLSVCGDITLNDQLYLHIDVASNRISHRFQQVGGKFAAVDTSRRQLRVSIFVT